MGVGQVMAISMKASPHGSMASRLQLNLRSMRVVGDGSKLERKVQYLIKSIGIDTLLQIFFVTIQTTANSRHVFIPMMRMITPT